MPRAAFRVKASCRASPSRDAMPLAPRHRTIPYTPQLERWSAPLRDREPDPALSNLAVRTPDGVALFAQCAGHPERPGIVFIHGFSQCHLAWRRQMQDPSLAAQFRLVAYDLRGHGASDKPAGPEAYTEDRRWADELAAVIEAAQLKRPVLVAWSYAGRVVADYVRAYGQDGIAGINYVAAATKTDRSFWGAEMRHLGVMGADDLTTNIRATRKFVRACFSAPPSGEEMDLTLASTMLTPASVRAAMLRRTRDAGDVQAQLRVPVLVTHGAMDRIMRPAASVHTATAVPRARLSIYEGVGHSPFFEDAPRFNRELAEFVSLASG